MSCGLKLPMLSSRLTRILWTSFEELSSGTLRLFLCSVPYADGTASAFDFHRLLAGCRLASFHEAGNLAILKKERYIFVTLGPSTCHDPHVP